MKRVITIILIFISLFSAESFATERNILPRFPEIVIEKEYSQYFKVKTCKAKATIEGDIAKTSLSAVLSNISDKDISSSVKFRILYPTGLNNISIKINGKDFKYEPENPRYSFSLKPQEDIDFSMNAHVYINYSIDAVRDSLKRMEKNENQGGVRNKKSVKNKGQELGESFMRLFKANDRYGRRFQVGSLVSKWGLFPVDFENLSLEVTVPGDFTVITSFESIWQDKTKTKKAVTYKTSDVDNYGDAVFLPSADKEEHLATMEVLKSSKFKY